MRIGAIALLASVALFIAAPSTWGQGVVDHGGRVTQNSTTSIAAPRTLGPSHAHGVTAAGHTLVVVVLVVALGASVLICTGRLTRVEAVDSASPALDWVLRRGPPRRV
jgi:hypothetical protein